jgi:hypothetical protein
MHAMIEPAELANRGGVLAGDALPSAAEWIEQPPRNAASRKLRISKRPVRSF